MFFPKLRARAKWVFLFLAIAFAASFVLFGVGTGFGGLQDILLQERVSGGGPSEDEARERTVRNPRDAQAWRDLATALQNQGKTEESLQPLARYTELRPNDIESQRELAGLYLQQADRYRFEAQQAQIELQTDVPGTTFQPQSSSKIGQALASNPLNDALSAEHNATLTAAFTRINTAYTKAVAALKKVAAAEPNDAAIQFELAQTAEAANETETAIAAYKKFLELAPDDQTADAVRERIKLLEARVSAGAGG